MPRPVLPGLPGPVLPVLPVPMLRGLPLPLPGLPAPVLPGLPEPVVPGPTARGSAARDTAGGTACLSDAGSTHDQRTTQRMDSVTARASRRRAARAGDLCG